MLPALGALTSLTGGGGLSASEETSISSGGSGDVRGENAFGDTYNYRGSGSYGGNVSGKPNWLLIGGIVVAALAALYLLKK